MAKYRVRFTEECAYEVEFESDHTLKELEEDADLWFFELDWSADDDWARKNLTEVRERDLISIERVKERKQA